MATQTISMSKLYRRYKPRMLRLLGKIRAALVEAGYEMDEPYEMNDEEYSWWLCGGLPGRDPTNQRDHKDFDITAAIIESQVRDGEDPFGVSFSMSICEYGGAIIGMFMPYNYTADVWVSRKDPEAVAGRWELFGNGCNPAEIVAVLNEHYKERQTA